MRVPPTPSTMPAKRRASRTALRALSLPPWSYDRAGRVAAVSYGNDTPTYAYNALGLRTAETYSGSGTLGANGGLSITRAYDPLFRRTAVFLASQSNATLN